ncbi:hypothetical protein [Candidatus Nitrosocosmicus franklandus]|uniref:Uncharacterized protein n=1 Tax=Candidatus Nitrosocosmicus franklandianus TaxID=1798806 RepID=A0A484IFF5_9ARCH|nr:hypothetical protein [Candidatus Nitrosocosmicus franklandus]VFJ14889.1 protein of unknown function [Candidatus Nitrosocosmicus franklandus]
MFREYTNFGITEISEKELKIQEKDQLRNKNKPFMQRCFMIVFVDLPENFESGESQKQLKDLFGSYRFI